MIKLVCILQWFLQLMHLCILTWLFASWGFICTAATNLFKMLLKYRPEDKAAKKERLLKRAQAEAEGKTVEAKKPIVVKYGLDHVTYLIEQVCSCCALATTISCHLCVNFTLLNVLYFYMCQLIKCCYSLTCRARHSLWSLLMMSTPLNSSFGSQPCAGRWKSLIALWRERLVLDQYV